MVGLAATATQLRDDLLQRRRVAGDEEDAGAGAGGTPGGGKSDAGTRAGDDDGLLRQRLQPDLRHGGTSSVRGDAGSTASPPRRFPRQTFNVPACAAA